MVHIEKFLAKHFLVAILSVFLLAIGMRFYLLSSFPVSLSMDEAAIGYNAYSILKTGKDEFGEPFPLAFRSAGDYKPPVNIYLTVPSIFLFGLNEFAVRLPTALLGAATAFFLVLLARSLGLSRTASLLAGFWLAVLPWHIHFSRGGFEAITALFFLVAGAWLFIVWTKDKKTYQLVGSAVLFSLSLWSYHAERLFVPLLALFLVILYWDKIDIKTRKIKKQIILTVIFLSLLITPFVKLTIFTPAVSERVLSTSIMREASLNTELHEGRYSNFSEGVFDNDYYLIFRHWLGKYLNYYDVRFWFWKALFTPPGFPDLGLLYAVDIPLFLLGVYVIAKSANEKLQKLSLFWFLVGPIPASVTMNEQHPLRALVWIPFFALVVALGFGFLLATVKKRWAPIGYFVLLLLSVVYFADMYIHHFPRFHSEFWQYGYKDVATYACENLDNYDHIVITDTFGSDGPLNTGLPYVYVLFYCERDRDIFLSTGKHSDKLIFRRPNREDFMRNDDMLLIGSPWDFLGDLSSKGKTLKEVTFLNGKPAFIFKTNK
jgi:4-amino-4-deoxy-L-arabinose transferase-like glycosyltransferase